MERKSFFMAHLKKLLVGETFFSRKRNQKFLDGVSMMNVTSLVVWANQPLEETTVHVSFRYGCFRK